MKCEAARAVSVNSDLRLPRPIHASVLGSRVKKPVIYCCSTPSRPMWLQYSVQRLEALQSPNLTARDLEKR